MTPKEVFEACQSNDVPLDVMNVCGSAADNAALTINENGGKFVRGEFTDEFISIWILTVEGILSNFECPQVARDWFESRGVTF
jgi:hypothetical protein